MGLSAGKVTAIAPVFVNSTNCCSKDRVMAVPVKTEVIINDPAALDELPATTKFPAIVTFPPMFVSFMIEAPPFDTSDAVLSLNAAELFVLVLINLSEFSAPEMLMVEKDTGPKNVTSAAPSTINLEVMLTLYTEKMSAIDDPANTIPESVVVPEMLRDVAEAVPSRDTVEFKFETFAVVAVTVVKDTDPEVILPAVSKPVTFIVFTVKLAINAELNVAVLMFAVPDTVILVKFAASAFTVFATDNPPEVTIDAVASVVDAESAAEVVKTRVAKVVSAEVVVITSAPPQTVHSADPENRHPVVCAVVNPMPTIPALEVGSISAFALIKSRFASAIGLPPFTTVVGCVV